MPWTNHPGPTPHRSEAELLETVRLRARAIRRARRARLSAAMGGVLAVLVAATALARAGDDPSTKLEVVGPVSTTATTTPTTAAPTTTTTPTAAVSTTIRSPTTVPPTTARTTRPAPTTTVPRTTTTAPDVRVACDASEVVVTATTDRSTYPQGAKVVVTAKALNRGSRPCFPHDPSLQIFNAAGVGLGGIGVADAFTMGSPGEPPPTWSPGETLSWPYEWSQPCGAGPCPPGQYTVVASFGPFRSTPATFTIT